MPESMLQNPERLGREQPIEITAEIQGNYLNFKQKEAENFIIEKVNESQPLFGNYRLRAAGFRNKTTRTLNKIIRTREQNFFPKSRVFLIFSQKTRLNCGLFAQSEGHMNNEEMLRVIRRHTIEAILPVMRVAVYYRKGQKNYVPQLKSYASL